MSAIDKAWDKLGARRAAYSERHRELVEADRDVKTADAAVTAAEQALAEKMNARDEAAQRLRSAAAAVDEAAADLQRDLQGLRGSIGPREAASSPPGEPRPPEAVS